MRILIGALFACCAFAQTSIYVRNAANAFASAGVAPGSLIEVGLTFPRGPVQPIDPHLVTLRLSEVGIESRDLPVLDSESPFSVLAFLPANIPVGAASVQLLANGIDQGSVTVQIVASNFNLFSQSGLAVAQNILQDRTVQPNSLTRPVAPGGFVTLWGTGLGQATQDQVSVTIGGAASASILFAGPSGLRGVDQINIQIPDDPAIPEGCYVAVDVQVGNKPSFRGAIAYSRTASVSCKHPLGLTPGELQELDAGHSITVASASISSDISPVFREVFDWSMLTRSDGASFMLLDLDAAGVAVRLGTPLATDQTRSVCSLDLVSGVYGIIFPARGLSAGDKLNLAGPQGKALELQGPFYSANIESPAAVSSPDGVADSFFTPGIWRLSGLGSSDIKMFSVELPLTASLRITNAAALSVIDRWRDTEVRWNAQAFSPDQSIYVSLSSSGIPGPGTVSCTAPANLGAITIPARLLQQLDSESLPNTQPPSFRAFVSGRSDHLRTFRLEQTSGPSIPGLFRQSSAEIFAVSFQ